MRQHEFENLAVGDLCTINRGYDKEKLVEVLYIGICPNGETAILVKPIKGTLYDKDGTVCRRYFKVVNARDLTIFNYKD